MSGKHLSIIHDLVLRKYNCNICSYEIKWKLILNNFKTELNKAVTYVDFRGIEGYPILPKVFEYSFIKFDNSEIQIRKVLAKQFGFKKQQATMRNNTFIDIGINLKHNTATGK